MVKKLFDWTPRDIAYWEKIQQRGLGRFILMYGVVASGGFLFLLIGLITVFGWIRGSAGEPNLIYLAGQLLFVALVSLIFGIINSLITWVVEQRLYRKYKAKQIQ